MRISDPRAMLWQLYSGSCTLVMMCGVFYADSWHDGQISRMSAVRRLCSLAWYDILRLKVAD